MHALATRGRLVRADRAGFTVLEFMIVLLIGAVLTGMAMPRLSQFAVRQDVRNARDSFMSLAKRTQATAVQRGRAYRVEIDPAADRAWVVSGRTGSGDTLEIMHYSVDSHVNVETSTSAKITVCYSPRGFAIGSCTSVVNSPVTVSFARRGYTMGARVRPLGQVEAW